MDIKRSGAQPSARGSAEYFTGAVRLDPLFAAPAPARVAGTHVTFEPGARTAWHTHPLGHTSERNSPPVIPEVSPSAQRADARLSGTL